MATTHARRTAENSAENMHHDHPPLCSTGHDRRSTFGMRLLTERAALAVRHAEALEAHLAAGLALGVDAAAAERAYQLAGGVAREAVFAWCQGGGGTADPRKGWGEGSREGGGGRGLRGEEGGRGQGHARSGLYAHSAVA